MKEKRKEEEINEAAQLEWALARVMLTRVCKDLMTSPRKLLERQHFL